MSKFILPRSCSLICIASLLLIACSSGTAVQNTAVPSVTSPPSISPLPSVTAITALPSTLEVVRSATSVVPESTMETYNEGVAQTETARPAVSVTVTLEAGVAVSPTVYQTPITATAGVVVTTMQTALPFLEHMARVTDFSDGAGDWPLAQTGAYTTTASDGVYQMQLVKPGQFLVVTPSGTPLLTNGEISADVALEGPDGYGGVVIRYARDGDARSMYLCWLNTAAKFGCSKNVDNKWSVLVGPKADDVIKPDLPNRITLAVEGKQIRFTINGKEVVVLEDASIKQGSIGLYAENADDPFSVSFDNVTILELKE